MRVGALKQHARDAVLGPCCPAAHGAARGGRRVAAALADVARGRPGARLGPAERHAMALTQGLAHGAAHSFIFYFRSAALRARARRTCSAMCCVRCPRRSAAPL